MGLFDLFRRKTLGSQPRIRNERELKAFFLDTTRDERLAQFLVEVADKVGRDGYLAVERGGYGQPYEAEYPGQERWRSDSRPSSEIQAEHQSLRQRISLAQSDSERDQLERQLADLACAFCIIRLNVMTTDEFERQRSLIVESWKRLKEIARGAG